MSACEKCWKDAGCNQEAYNKLIDERDEKGISCTPEEQAGDASWECKYCGRKTVHQHAQICVNTDCEFCGVMQMRPRV